MSWEASGLGTLRPARAHAPAPRGPAFHVRDHGRLQISRLGAYERFFATCHPGLESVVERELTAMGARDVTVASSGVSFSGQGLEAGYRADLELRAAIRVLNELHRFHIDPDRHAGDEIYERVRAAAHWAELVPEGGSFSVDARIRSCSSLTSSLLAKKRVKDAVCDAIADAQCARPQPPADGLGDVPLFIACFRNQATLYRDMSGLSLHRRGYREAMHKASLNEAAAAGMLEMAGWLELAQEGGVLLDPMCGSGTFLIEAALMACRVAPGLLRPQHSWPFGKWPDHDPSTWAACVERAQAAVRPWNGVLLGNDPHPGALALASQGAKAAGVQSLIKLSNRQLQVLQLPLAPSLVVTNPPWGRRLQPGRGGGREGQGLRSEGPAEGQTSQEELQETWQALGQFLKRCCSGSDAYVLSGNMEITRNLRLRAAKRHPVSIGGVDCRLLRYPIS